jgi:hypothetical protein
LTAVKTKPGSLVRGSDVASSITKFISYLKDEG